MAGKSYFLVNVYSQNIFFGTSLQVEFIKVDSLIIVVVFAKAHIATHVRSL